MIKVKKAVVLSSGGIDSTTVMAIARKEGFSIFSLSFNYGQRHSFELESARKVARYFEVSDHMIIDIDLRRFGGSSLTDETDVPKKRKESEITGGIPVTYVPARNTIFLSYALAWAEVLGTGDIFIGVTAVDYSGYPDCRPEYIHAFEKMANLATKAGVEYKIKLSIKTPLINLAKAEIITLGNKLGVDYSITHSCYDPSPEGLACGACDSCIFRKKGFIESGVKDPTRYIRI
ncbi:7-cyano-7-deazaguanine synthase QueC [Thermodesulfobacteriota bacterium]